MRVKPRFPRTHEVRLRNNPLPKMAQVCRGSSSFTPFRLMQKTGMLSAALLLAGCATHPIEPWERLPFDKVLVPVTMPVAFPMRAANGEKLSGKKTTPGFNFFTIGGGLLTGAGSAVAWPFVEVFELVTGRSPWPSTSFGNFEPLYADKPKKAPQLEQEPGLKP